MRFFRGSYEVGTYALVPQIIQAIQFIPYALTLSRFPELVALSGEEREDFYRLIVSLIQQLALFGGAVGIALSGFAMVGFQFVFGQMYQTTVSILIIGSLSLPFLFLRQITTKVFICDNRGRHLAFIELFGLAFSVCANTILIPLYGGQAAIGVFGVTCFLTVMLSLVFFDRGALIWRIARIRT